VGGSHVEIAFGSRDGGGARGGGPGAVAIVDAAKVAQLALAGQLGVDQPEVVSAAGPATK